MIYEWKSGSRVNADAQIAGEMCARLEKEGRLTAQVLLDENRPAEAPLHGCFEWNDNAAAENWRVHQARNIINSLVVKVEDREPIRAYFKVEAQERNYFSIDTIIRNEDSSKKLFDNVLSELRSIRKKYDSITKFKEVWDAIDAIGESA